MSGNTINSSFFLVVSATHTQVVDVREQQERKEFIFLLFPASAFFSVSLHRVQSSSPLPSADEPVRRRRSITVGGIWRRTFDSEKRQVPCFAVSAALDRHP